MVVGVIEALLTPSGRVNAASLVNFAKSCELKDFCRFLQRPVLAGSAVQPGMMAGSRDKNNLDPNATLAFQMSSLSDQESLSDALKHAIYPLVKAPDATRAEHVFTIGRLSGNDVVIPDLAISKRHALIEIREQGYFIRDCGSKNGTWVNDAPLGESFKEILDGYFLAFGRYGFSFLQPQSLYRRLVGD